MKNLIWQNPEQLFVAQELINKVKSKCCGIKDYKAIHTKEGNIIPFNESALTSLKYNSSMRKKAHYIKIK